MTYTQIGVLFVITVVVLILGAVGALDFKANYDAVAGAGAGGDRHQDARDRFPVRGGGPRGVRDGQPEPGD